MSPHLPIFYLPWSKCIRLKTVASRTRGTVHDVFITMINKFYDRYWMWCWGYFNWAWNHVFLAHNSDRRDCYPHLSNWAQCLSDEELHSEGLWQIVVDNECDTVNVTALLLGLIDSCSFANVRLIYWVRFLIIGWLFDIVIIIAIYCSYALTRAEIAQNRLNM